MAAPTPITRYSKIAREAIPFQNYPGGGITNQGSPAAGDPYAAFNDPGLEIGDMRLVTAVYQMYGNEAANDIINIYLAQPGTQVSVDSDVTSTGIATTATILVGDDDTTGAGLVSGDAVILGADPSRYSGSLNVAAASTTVPTLFSGGSSLGNPYRIGITAIEPAGASPGAGIAGSWIQATFATMSAPVAGKCLIFRLQIIKP